MLQNDLHFFHYLSTGLGTQDDINEHKQFMTGNRGYSQTKFDNLPLELPRAEVMK